MVDLEKFLKGETFSKKELSRFFSHITKKPETEESYMEYVNKIKSILSKSKVKHHLNSIFVNSNKSLSKVEEIILIRFINLVPKYRDKVIIYNDVVIYTPYKCDLCVN